MKTTTGNKMSSALRRALPGITPEEIQKLQADELTRQQLKMLHGALLDSITAKLYKHDIEGLAFDGRDLEYEGEAAKILLRLPDCASLDACQSVIHLPCRRRLEPLPNPS